MQLLYLLVLAQTPTEKLLLEKIAQLEMRLAALEGKPVAPVPQTKEKAKPPETTVNFYLDGYYGYNFNRPSGGVNELRAYDASHNSFTLNQGTMVLERAASLNEKRYVGGRLDLQFGQATNTLQGNAVNEPRPGIYRNIFQAYGTVIAPVGKGITVDMGKFASSLGLESNYAKDQMNYSRSYFFNYLPFYHMGLRATYPVTSRINATYWLVNGANQTEDFNGFKSQAVILNFNPSSSVSGNVNYYAGRETPDGRAGRFHVLDTYWNWNVNSKITLAGELDSVVSRSLRSDAPKRVTGGVAYARYRLNPRWSLASRFGVLNDRGGLFSGATQNLREVTLTSTFELTEGFQMRWEYRRDMSNQAYFSTDRAGVLKKEMNTALLGLIWWFGGKQGAW
jgi:hypothetical protein